MQIYTQVTVMMTVLVVMIYKFYKFIFLCTHISFVIDLIIWRTCTIESLRTIELPNLNAFTYFNTFLKIVLTPTIV